MKNSKNRKRGKIVRRKEAFKEVELRKEKKKTKKAENTFFRESHVVSYFLKEETENKILLFVQAR